MKCFMSSSSRSTFIFPFRISSSILRGSLISYFLLLFPLSGMVCALFLRYVDQHPLCCCGSPFRPQDCSSQTYPIQWIIKMSLLLAEDLGVTREYEPNCIEPQKTVSPANVHTPNKDNRHQQLSSHHHILLSTFFCCLTTLPFVLCYVPVVFHTSNGGFQSWGPVPSRLGERHTPLMQL